MAGTFIFSLSPEELIVLERVVTTIIFNVPLLRKELNEGQQLWLTFEEGKDGVHACFAAEKRSGGYSDIGIRLRHPVPWLAAITTLKIERMSTAATASFIRERVLQLLAVGNLLPDRISQSGKMRWLPKP